MALGPPGNRQQGRWGPAAHWGPAGAPRQPVHGGSRVPPGVRTHCLSHLLKKLQKKKKRQKALGLRASAPHLLGGERAPSRLGLGPRGTPRPGNWGGVGVPGSPARPRPGGRAGGRTCDKGRKNLLCKQLIWLLSARRPGPAPFFQGPTPLRALPSGWPPLTASQPGRPTLPHVPRPHPLVPWSPILL